MHPFLFTTFALDLANDRRREAEADYLASQIQRRGRPGLVRRGLAAGASSLSRAFAAAARRLDARAVEYELRDRSTAA